MWEMSAATPVGERRGGGDRQPSSLCLFWVLRRIIHQERSGDDARKGREGNREESFLLTRSHADIVQGQLGNSGVELKQQGQRLANATGSAKDGHLGQLERVAKCLSAKTVVDLPLPRGRAGHCRRLGVKGKPRRTTTAANTNLAGRGREGTALDPGSSEHVVCVCVWRDV